MVEVCVDGGWLVARGLVAGVVVDRLAFGVDAAVFSWDTKD